LSADHEVEVLTPRSIVEAMRLGLSVQIHGSTANAGNQFFRLVVGSAMTPESDYVQVVGDHLRPLNTKEIARAVANAPKEKNPEFSKERPLPLLEARTDLPVPAVIVKKRRIAVMP
jgi:hypothetical protein